MILFTNRKPLGRNCLGKFEAGTPNIAGAIALGAAVDYLSALGMENIHAYEQELVDYVLPKLQAIDGLTVYGPEDPSQHAGVIALILMGFTLMMWRQLLIMKEWQCVRVTTVLSL